MGNTPQPVVSTPPQRGSVPVNNSQQVGVATLAPPNAFIGRQAILDREKKPFGYELLFRANQSDNFFPNIDGDRATGKTINTALNVLGLQTLTNGQKAFINVTRRMLLAELYTVLPANDVVIELLENVEPDDGIVQACKRLKEKGYLLALDDFVYDPRYEPLLDLADFVKIQFHGTSENEVFDLTERFTGRGASLIAEKVETPQDFQRGLTLGYSYFQGYFFCKPEIVAGREIPAFKRSYMQFIQQVNQPALDFAELERIIKQEVSLSVKLLRYLNSASFGMRTRIESIKQALALIGAEQLKSWASIVALSSLGEDKPTELVTVCLIRARFCEEIAPMASLEGRRFDLFLMGLLSAMDALVDQPLSQVVADMPLPHDVTAAMLGSSTKLGTLYGLLMACERSIHKAVPLLSAKLNLDPRKVSDTYCGAMLWADQVLHR